VLDLVFRIHHCCHLDYDSTANYPAIGVLTSVRRKGPGMGVE
jgi:hypothetical protein